MNKIDCINGLFFTFSNETLQNVGMAQARSATEMEAQIFQKAHSQEEYRNMITKIVMHMQSKFKNVFLVSIAINVVLYLFM